MEKLKEIAGPSCLTNAADDEPLFVLRANDELAPQLVSEWAFRYYEMKGGAAGLSTAQRDKFLEAIALARDMVVWKESKAKRGEV